MFGADLIIRSKLIPPRTGPRRLYRERLNQLLGQALDQPLTLVIAGAGYGKSTAVAHWLADVPWAVAWYSVSPADQDPLLFILHLIYAFENITPGVVKEALIPFETPNASANIRQRALNLLLNELTTQLNEEILLIIDDIHLALDNPEINEILEQLINYLPPQLHLIISSRLRPNLAALTVMEARGQVAHLSRLELAFQPPETLSLFRGQYNITLSDEQILTLHHKSEGWAIALQLIAQRLQAQKSTLPNFSASLETLFAFLAQDVLTQQSQEIQDFLIQTAILEALTPSACNYLLEISNSADILSHLAEQDFFVIKLDEASYRYHHLLAEFLHTRLNNPSHLHQRIAQYYQAQNRSELAIHHYLQAGSNDRATQLLLPLAPELVRAGRFNRLGEWLALLPPESLRQSPTLLVAYGDLYRFTNRYHKALTRYEQATQIFNQRNDPAGESDALLGQARVYLDTVRPAKAQEPLQQAKSLIARYDLHWKEAELLALEAENEANLGHAATAQLLQEKSSKLLGGQASTSLEVETRLLLRSGHLEEAREKLSRQAQAEERAKRSAWAPRQHRETLLLLSFICALQGQPQQARAYAQEGVEIGKRLGATFIEAVACMRLGHAWQIDIDANPERAERYYQRAITLSEAFEVSRIKLEPLWGLLRLRGFYGDLAGAIRYGEEALKLAHRAGDGWMAAWTKTILAASHLLANQIEPGLAQMQTVRQDFIQNGDLFGQAVTWLWQALYEADAETTALTSLLKLAQQENYTFLFASPGMAVPPDPQSTIPLLLKARKHKIALPYITRLLNNLNLGDIDNHPGFTLRVQTLGPFRVWCGANRIGSQAWQREKARHLFQLLLTQRNQYLQKEQIFDTLWPDIPLKTAEKHFKVALNTLHSVIEPSRPPRATPFFVRRRGSSYGLMINSSIIIDCIQFAEHIQRGLNADDQNDLTQAISQYQQAIDLYQGDYLSQSLYEDWTVEERERLLNLYLQTAERLARLRLQNGQPAEAIILCQAILSRDNCWEAAYRLLMLAHYRHGNRPQALRTFELCRQTLDESLAIPPMEQTIKLYNRLLYHQSISLQDV